MKKTHSRRLRNTVVSFILAAAMLFAFLAPVSAGSLAGIKENLDGNGDGKINYVAIGSSATAGVGLADGGYKNPPADSYPALIKSELETTGKTVELSQLGIPGMRAEDLRYLLDSAYSGDAYTKEKLLADGGAFKTLGVDTLRADFANAIADAEVITLEVGADNFLTYAIDYAFNAEYKADFTIFDDGLQRSVEELKGKIESVIEGYAEDGDSPETSALLQRVVDGVAYALVGYAVNIDAVIGEIYKVNPDVTLTVLNIRNPLEGLQAEISGFDFEVPLADIYAIVVDMANIYMASLSEYAGSFNYAYVSSVETFADEFSAYSGTLTPEMTAYLNEFSDVGNGALTPAALDTLAKLIKAGVDYTSLDFTAAATSKKDIASVVESIVAASANAGFSLEANAEYQSLIGDAGAMTKLAAAVRYGFGSLPTLPNKNGHAAIADALVSAISSSAKGSDVVANDMNPIYAELINYLDRETLVDLEYTFTPYYVLNPNNSYYVAIGDGSATGRNSYVVDLADQLGLSDKIPSKNKYKNMAKDGATPASVLADIGSYTSELLKADLITVSFNNASTTAYMIEQLMNAFQGKAVEDNDWSAILGEEIAAEVDQAIEDIKAELVTAVGDETMSNALVAAVESYVYAYASRVVSYPILIDTIHSITRGDALVVVVGAYNDMANISVTLEGETIALGDYMQYLVDIANLETLAYSAFTENTAYVTCPEVTTKLGTKNIDLTNLSNMLSLLDLTKIENYNPTDASHAEIADVIYKTLEIVPPHICDYDNDCDKRCNICMDKRNVPDHVFDGVCDEECNVCGTRNKTAVLHTYQAACDSTCDVCHKERESADHEYLGACDSTCDLCGMTREVSNEHTFGEWVNGDSEKTRTCTVCGTVEREKLADAEDGGLGTGAIIAIVCVAVVVLVGGGAAVYFLVIKKKPAAASKANEAKPDETKSDEE